MTVIAPSTKEQIVLAAEGLFAERGIEGVSLRQIGTAAGNGNNSAVQYHFGTKERLVQAVFEYRLPRLRERRDLLLVERRPDDLRAWVECEARWMFEQSELEDSNYMSFVSMLTQYGRTDLFDQLPDDLVTSTRAYHAHISSLLAHLDEPLRTHRIRRAMASLVHAAADRERAGAAASRRCRSPSRSATWSTASSATWRRPRRPRPSPRCSGARRDRPRPALRRHRSTRPVRPDALRRARLPRRRVDPAPGRDAGGVVRTRGLRAVLGRHQARRHPRRRLAAGALLQRARPDDRPQGRSRSADRDGRHPRSAAPRPPAPGRHAPVHAARDQVTPRRDRATRARGARRHPGCGLGRRGVRLRPARGGAVADCGHRLVPRCSPRRPGAAVPLDQRDHRQGRPRVPPSGRDARPRRSSTRASRCTRISPSWSSGTGASRATTS